MLWHDSFKELLSCEQAIDSLIKIDNAKSHTRPGHLSLKHDSDDDESIGVLNGLDAQPSQSLENLGHFSFPISPRQKTLLLNGEPFQTPKYTRRHPTRSTSFDDALRQSTEKKTLRKRRKHPNRASSADDLGKWAKTTTLSTLSNVCKPTRRLSNDFKDAAYNNASINVAKPMRRLSNSSAA